MSDLKTLLAKTQSDVNAALAAIAMIGSDVAAAITAVPVLAPATGGVPDYVLGKLPNAKLLRAFDTSKISYNPTSISGVDFCGGVRWWRAPPPPDALSIVNGNLVLTARKTGAGWSTVDLQTDDGSGTGFFVPDHSFIEVGFQTDAKGGGNFWSMPKTYFTSNANHAEEDFVEVFGSNGGVQTTMHLASGGSGDKQNGFDSVVGLGNQRHVWGFYRPAPTDPVIVFIDGIQVGSVARYPTSGGLIGLILGSEANYMDGSGDGGLTEVKTTFSLLRVWA